MDPVAQAVIFLTDVSEFVAEILTIYPKDGSKPSGDLAESGVVCLNLCEKGATFAGQVDIRGLTTAGMEKSLFSFVGLATAYNSSHGDKANLAVKRLSKKIEQLSEMLKMNWNSSLDMPSQEQIKSKPPSAHLGMVGPNPMGLGLPVFPPLPGTRSSPSGCSSPPPNIQSPTSSSSTKPVLKKVTPLKAKEEYPCQFCPKKFTNVQSYKKHSKDKHDFDDKQVSAQKVTCMIEVKDKDGASRRCNARQPLAKMYRHLASHNIKRVKEESHGDETFLRFFKSVDGGKTFTDAIFLRANEEDPGPDEVTYYDDMAPDSAAVGSNSAASEESSTVPCPAASVPIVNTTEERMEIDSQENESGEEPKDNPSQNNNLLVSAERKTTDSSNQTISVPSSSNPFVDSSDKEILQENQAEEDSQPNNNLRLLADRNTKVQIKDNNKNFEIIKDLNNVGQELEGEESEEDDHDNSNIEQGDDEEFKATLEKNREKRYEMRNKETEEESKTWESERNKPFVEEFHLYLQTVKYGANPNKDTSTINKTLNQIFKFKDSFLSFNTKEDPTFTLDQLLMFSSPELLQLKYPMPWIETVFEPDGSINPSSRKEYLKSWARLRDFISHKILSHDFNLETELIKQEVLQRNLSNIDTNLSRHKVWAGFENQIKSNKREKENALAIANPSDNKNEVLSVKKWFESDKFRELHEKLNQTWASAVADESSLKPADFVEFALFTKFNLMLLDKNRTSSYGFSNEELIVGVKLWYPEDFKAEVFTALPNDWDVHLERDRKHDAVQINLGGQRVGTKNQTGTTVTVNGVALSLVEKFRDLKQIAFKDRPELNSPKKPFFVNFKGSEIDGLKNSKGSLLEVYSETVGVKHATVNSIRRGLDNFLINSNVSRKRVKIAGGHSEKVQLEYYDKRGADARSEITYQASQYESESVNVIEEDVPEETRAKRARRDNEDEEVRKQYVDQILNRSKKSRVTIGRNMKVLPEDRTFLQQLLSSSNYRHLHNLRKDVQFPGIKSFKKQFYRLVDGENLSNEDQRRVSIIERRVFDACREDILKEASDKKWSGSKEQNRRADVIVATKIRTSFRVFETARSGPKESYFVFKQ